MAFTDWGCLRIPVCTASVYIVSLIDKSPPRIRYEAVRSSLDERSRRLSAAAEAKAAGCGGIAAASRVTKLARSTIGRGLKDLRDPGSLGRVRRKGGGNPRLTMRDPTLLADLERLFERATMGVSMRPLRWVSKSHDKLATALRAMGHKVSSSFIPKMLEELKYCRHFNRRTKEGGKHPDRDVEEFHAADQPVIWIDAKKKELLGEFKNGGSDYSPQGRPIEVNTHDFEDKELGKVVPYGPYGSTHRRQRRLCQPWNRPRHRTIRRQQRSALARSDRPGALSRDEPSHDHRRWRRVQWFTSATLEVVAATTRRRNRPDHSGLPLSARHFQVEQDRASHVLLHHPELARHTSRQPLRRNRADRQHHDKKGLSISCELDRNTYPKGIKVSDAEMASLNITRDAFHPEWNYKISPRDPNMKR